MSTIYVEIEGEDGREQAELLELELREVETSPSEHNEVEVTRMIESAGDLVTIVSAAISGMQTIKTIWSWWQGQKDELPARADVHIVLPDGTRLQLNDLSEDQYNEVLRRLIPSN